MNVSRDETIARMSCVENKRGKEREISSQYDVRIFHAFEFAKKSEIQKQHERATVTNATLILRPKRLVNFKTFPQLLR